MQHDLLFATDNNGAQSPFPDDWAHHPRPFSKQHFPDVTHSDASYPPCYLGHRQLSWLGLCKYTPSQSRQLAIRHSDVCYIYANRMSAWWSSKRTHHFGLRVKNFENPIFQLGYLSLNARYNSDRLYRTNCFCLCTFRPILTLIKKLTNIKRCLTNPVTDV